MSLKELIQKWESNLSQLHPQQLLQLVKFVNKSQEVK